MKDIEQSLEIISKPILPDEIEWKVQSYSKDKSGKVTKTIIVPYIQVRAVMDRFDAAFGPLGWKSSFRDIGDGFICTLSVFDGENWISKEDGANKTTIEPVKGGISDSMKRAAHQFGLGRGLYNYPKVFLTGEFRYIPDEAIKRLNNMVTLINQGNFNKKIVIL